MNRLLSLLNWIALLLGTSIWLRRRELVLPSHGMAEFERCHTIDTKSDSGRNKAVPSFRCKSSKCGARAKEVIQVKDENDCLSGEFSDDDNYIYACCYSKDSEGRDRGREKKSQEGNQAIMLFTWLIAPASVEDTPGSPAILLYRHCASGTGAVHPHSQHILEAV